MANTGYKSPTAYGTLADDWSDGGNLLSDNEQFCTSTIGEPYESVSSFGFSIPSNATITGVEYKVKAKAASGSSQLSATLGCVNDNYEWGTNVEILTLTTTNTEYTLGGPTTKWGETMSPADFSDASFTVTIFNRTGSVLVSVDHIEVDVYYTLPESTTQANSSTANIKATQTQDNSVCANIPGINTNSSRAWIQRGYQYPRDNFLIETFYLYNLTISTYSASYRFTADKTTTITEVYLPIYLMAGTCPTYTVGIQADSSGNPDGSWLGGNASVDKTFVNTRGWQTCTLGTAASVTAGSIYHVVIIYKSGTINTSNYVSLLYTTAPANTASGGYAYPRNIPIAGITYNKTDVNLGSLYNYGLGGGWIANNYARNPILAFKYSDSTYQGTGYTTINSLGAYSNTWVGEKIIAAESALIYRLWFYVSKGGSPADSLYYEIHDTSHVVLSSGTVVTAANCGTSKGWYSVDLSTAIGFSADSTYYIYLKSPLCVDLSNCYGVSCPQEQNNSAMDALGMGATQHALSYSTNAGGSYSTFNNYDMVVVGDAYPACLNSVKAYIYNTTFPSNVKANIWENGFENGMLPERWDLRYFASSGILPNNSTPGWGRSASGTVTEEFVNGTLHLTTGSSSWVAYYKNETFSNTIGSTVEWSTKFVSSTNNYDSYMEFQDGVYIVGVEMRDGFVRVVYATGYTYHDYTVNTSNFHSYRLTLKGQSFVLYQDNTQIATETITSTSTTNRILFGDWGAGGPAEQYWDYVAYTKWGVIPPHGLYTEANIIAEVTKDNSVEASISAVATQDNSVIASLCAVFSNSVKANFPQIDGINDNIAYANILVIQSQENSSLATIYYKDVINDSSVKAWITIQQTATGYSTASGDGEVLRDDTSWVGVHDTSIGTSVNTTAGYGPRVESTSYSISSYRIVRGFVPFHIDALRSNMYLISAYVRIYFSTGTDTDDDGKDYIGLYESTQTSPTTLTTSDFHHIGTTLLSDTVVEMTGHGAGFATFALNAAGLALLNSSIGSYVKFALREGHDAENSQITDNKTVWLNWVAADYSGTTYDPYISVTYNYDPLDLYWVGGSGSWSDATNHWARSSGGTPEPGCLPRSIDNVFIDDNSGLSEGRLSIGATAYCKNFTSTAAYTYELYTSSSYFWVYGSLVFDNYVIASSINVTLLSTESGNTIKSSGTQFKTMSVAGQEYSFGGDWTLLDDLDCASYFLHQSGIFDANDFDISCSKYYFTASNGYRPTVRMGSGQWLSFGNGTVWNITEYDGQVVNFIPETSEIYLSDNTIASKTFAGKSKTYYNLKLTGQGTGSFYITGSNTFNNLEIIYTPITIIFESGSTQTLLNFTGESGYADNLVTIDSSDDGQFYLSQSSGIITCNYFNIHNSVINANLQSELKGVNTAEDDATVGTIAWSDVNNAILSDDSYASAFVNGSPLSSHYLKSTNFGFSIPSEATIGGILVELESKLSGGALTWNDVRIVKNGVISSSYRQSASAALNPTEVYVPIPSSGASTDLWGETWTPDEINSSTFGVAASFSTTVVQRTGYIDHVRITVYYSLSKWYAVNSIDDGGNSGWIFINASNNFVTASIRGQEAFCFVTANILATSAKETFSKCNIYAIGQCSQSAKIDIIRRNETQINSSKAFIVGLGLNNNSVRANIFSVVERINSVKTDIIVTTSQSNNSIVNITHSILFDFYSTVNIIRFDEMQLNSSKASIVCTEINEQNVITDIFVVTSKNTFSLANIFSVSSCDNSVKSNVFRSGEKQENSVIVDILKTIPFPQNTVANIFAVSSFANLTKASVVVTETNGQSVKASIVVIEVNNNSSIGDILGTLLKSNSVVSNIIVRNQYVNSLVGNILRINESKDTSVTTSIIVTNINSSSSKASLVREESYNQNALSDIFATYNNINVTKADILGIETYSNKVIGDILASVLWDNIVKSNVRRIDETQENIVKTSIVKTEPYEVSSKTSIVVTVSLSGSTLANIWNFYELVNSSIADIFAISSYDNSVVSNILRINELNDNFSRASIIVTNEYSQNIVANIFNTYLYEQRVKIDIIVENIFEVSTKGEISSERCYGCQTMANLRGLIYDIYKPGISHLKKRKYLYKHWV